MGKVQLVDTGWILKTHHTHGNTSQITKELKKSYNEMLPFHFISLLLNNHTSSRFCIGLCHNRLSSCHHPPPNKNLGTTKISINITIINRIKLNIAVKNRPDTPSHFSCHAGVFCWFFCWFVWGFVLFLFLFFLLVK